MKTAVLLLAAVLALCGCTRLSDRGFDSTKIATDAERSTVIKLSDYAAFEWDHVYIYAPYTPLRAIKEEVGTTVPFPHADSESHCLLVFLSQGKIAATFEIERKPLDLAQLFRKGGYSREEAVFAVGTQGTDAWRYLKNKEANQSLEPTTTSVMPAADAPVTPAVIVAHH